MVKMFDTGELKVSEMKGHRNTCKTVVKCPPAEFLIRPSVLSANVIPKNH